MKLALFDFDNTVTVKDSLADFIQFAVGKPAYYFGLCLLFPLLFGFQLGLISNHRAKEKLIAHFFKNWEIDIFEKISNQYSLQQIDKIIRPEAMAKIRWHQQQKHTVVIVSASIECWLKPWCEKNKIELISTKLESKGGRLTGAFAGKNCNGEEKIIRVKEKYVLREFEYIYAYGDSSGDRHMLRIANEPYFRKF